MHVLTIVLDTGEAGDLTEIPIKTQTSTNENERRPNKHDNNGDRHKQPHNRVHERARPEARAGVDERRRAQTSTDEYERARMKAKRARPGSGDRHKHTTECTNERDHRQHRQERAWMSEGECEDKRTEGTVGADIRRERVYVQHQRGPQQQWRHQHQHQQPQQQREQRRRRQRQHQHQQQQRRQQQRERDLGQQRGGVERSSGTMPPSLLPHPFLFYFILLLSKYGRVGAVVVVFNSNFNN